MARKKYVFTIKSININVEKDNMAIYYSVRSIDEKAKDFNGSPIIGSYTDTINVDLHNEYSASIRNIIIQAFIKYAAENYLFGFNEFLAFEEKI